MPDHDRFNLPTDRIQSRLDQLRRDRKLVAKAPRRLVRSAEAFGMGSKTFRH